MPLDVCGVVFWSTYMYSRDANFMMRENQYHFVKDETYFFINAHKESKITLVSVNHVKALIISSRKFVFLFLRHNQQEDESIGVKESLEECTKEWKH